MTLALSIFDVFTYAVPGLLYLSILTYVVDRLGWITVDLSGNISALAGVLIIAIVSYLLGHLTYGLGSATDRLTGYGRRTAQAKRTEFSMRVASSSHRQSISTADPFLLLALIEVRAREAAIEPNRLRAVGLMLRNSGPPIIIASTVAFAEVALGVYRPESAAAGVLLLGGAVAAVRRGNMLRQWAVSKTLEVAFWMIAEDDLEHLGRDPWLDEPAPLQPAKERTARGSIQEGSGTA